MAEGGIGWKDENGRDQDFPKLTSTRQDVEAKKKGKLSKKEIESNNAKLKKIVVSILKNNPKGVKLSKIWNLVKTETKKNFSAADCGVSKLSKVLENWSDTITVTWSQKDPNITLQHGASTDNISSRSSSEVLFNDNNFPSLSRDSQSPKDKAKVETSTQSKAPFVGKSVEGHSDKRDASGMIGKSTKTQGNPDEILYERTDFPDYYTTDIPNRVIKTAKRKSQKKSETEGTSEENLQASSKPYRVIKTAKRKSNKAVELDLSKNEDKSSFSYSASNTVKQASEKVADGKGKDNPVPKSSQQEGLFGFQWAPVTQFNLPHNPSLALETEDPAIITGHYGLPTQNIAQVTAQSRLRNLNENHGNNYTNLLAGYQSQDDQIPVRNVTQQPVINGESRQHMDQHDNSKPVKVKPIDKDEFETKKIDVRPVYVAKGKKPFKEQINNVAKECIEILSDADLFVTQERVEKLVCQRFSCRKVQDLGLRYMDQVDCVNELNRLICKINVYVNAFVKTRAICTLHELKNELKEYATDDGDFSSLKTGPLQRYPVVFQQFRFPPDQSEIPEITTMDILDHFRTYLDIKGLWRTKMELEPFMDYLVEKYDAENAYMLGVRIRSLPLALTTLKKAQRDSAASRRDIKDHFEDELRNEIGEAFRKFRISIMQTGESEGMEVRKHYLKMKPELAIMEVFDKFNILLMVIQAGDVVLKKAAKFKKAIEDFLTVMRDNELGRNILHLALCMSNTSVEETVEDMFTPVRNDDTEDNSNSTHQQQQQPPRKDELAEKLRTYIERCLNAGALTLIHLDRIEEKLLEDFSFPDFTKMGYGRFLEFLLSEAKQMLEEGGGLSLGSSSGGSTDNDTSFKPNQTDIIEFIKQFKQHADCKPEQIEEALCRQYNVSDVRHLGHGNISRLLGHAGKASRHVYADFTVFYESAFLHSVRMSNTSNSKVGILGHQSKDAAKFCLHSCPLLENLADWSQWSLVFEPEHGKLKDFIQRYGGVTTKPYEDGRLVTLDFLALEIKPGVLIKIVSTTSPDAVAAALMTHDVVSTAGHLVSMVIAYKSTESMPLALLAGHVKTVLLQMHAGEPSSGINENGQVYMHSAAMFVLKCLLRIPTNFCVAFANQLFLDPLGQVVGSSKSKQLLIQLCSSNDELNKIMKLGCLLGIQEWTDVITHKCQPPVSDVQISAEEAKDFIENDNDIQEDEELMDEFEAEDVDDILTGGIVEEGKIDKIEEEHSAKKEENDNEGKDDHETKALETEDNGDIQDLEKVITEKPVELTCEDIVNQIRRDEFGVGVHLNEDGERLMKVQQERLGRSLDRLSKDLYSKDTHFVLELVQNADDNSYPDNLLDNSKDGCPSVKFVIEHDGIYVLNNELGFREKDIRALCDVGRSTKGKHKFGYIGQKGIGFKSVFRITDAPEVHSNGYHIRFDVNSGPMGYILPYWVSEEERISQDGWMTHIILKLKQDMRLHTRTLAARFNDLHPSLLLFLHRLRQITIQNKVENTVETIQRRDIGDNVVEIQHSGGCDRWMVIKKILDASNISLQTKSGAEVESTEIALAFPLKNQCRKNTVLMMPPKQPVFAFLPLRSYGFRFIIQGDFDVPSSREDVDRDSSWNQWLRNEIPNVFLETLDVFKTHSEFSSMEAVCTFLQFVPMEDEVLEFFKPVASDILKKLKAKPCIPTLAEKQGPVSWKIPSQTVKVRDPLVRSVITSDLLEKHLNLFYLHPDIATVLNPALTSCLGIENLTSDHLFQLGKALIVNMGTHCNKDEDVILISKWMACLYRSLDEFHHDDSILPTLKVHPFLPLSDGELVSLQEKTVFYPIPNLRTKKQKGKDPMYYLQQDVSSLHPLLLDTGDAEVNSQVHKLLLRLGVKQLSPSDVINHHIIPVLKSDSWKKKKKETLVSYMIYIKEQSDKQASVCNLDEVKNIAVVLTNDGFKNPSDEPVQFPTEYGNAVNLQEVFKGYDWTLLDTCYLPQTCTRPTLISWQEFFKKLGVEDFLSIRKKDVHLKKDELEGSYWGISSSVWPQDEEVYIVQDYYSAELEALIRNNKYPSGQHFEKQMQNLCMLLDRNWDTGFSKYCKTHVVDKDGKFLKETDTSFSILLQTSKWLPAEETEITDIDGYLKHEVRVVMKEPKSLYLPSNKVQSLLSDKVLYLAVNLTAGTFCQFLGLKNSVTLESVKSYLLQWCKREKDIVSATFYTSLEHMKMVYTYLGEELRKQELQDLLRDNPVFFVPVNSGYYNPDEVVKGKMLNRNEIWLMDKSGLFDKHRNLLEEYHSDIAKKRTIFGFYKDSPNIIELFKQEGKVDTQPRVEEFIELLCLLCNTSSPKDARVLLDVLNIFSTIGQALCTSPEGMPDERTANMALETLKRTVKKKLHREKVFPTTKQTWVSLEDHPMIPDNREWEKMFAEKEGVHFLDMEDKSNKVSRSVRGGVGNRGQRSKNIESRVNLEMINKVIDICGIRKLSECVDIRPVPEMIEPCLELQAYFCKIVPSVQKYLIAGYEDVYQQLENINTKEMLADAKFYQTGKLEVSYWFNNNLPKETFIIKSEKCVIHPPEFYFHRDHLNALAEINREIARYFSRGHTDCSRSLRSFLSELSCIVSGETDDDVDELLQRYDVDDLDIAEEELWMVEAPVLPEPDIPEEAEEEGEVSGEDDDINVTVASQDGEFQLRMWPPVASENKIHVTEGTEKPTSNIWPPPQAKDYMKSVKDLPSNIRMIVHKQTETQEDDDKATQPSTEIESSRTEQELKTYPVHQSDFERATGLVEDSKSQGAGGQLKLVSAGKLDENVGALQLEHKNTESWVTDNSTGVKVDNIPEISGKEGTNIDDREFKGHSSDKNNSALEDQGQGYGHRRGGDSGHHRRKGQHAFTRGQPIIKGDPIWTFMATDYLYEDLGTGKDLGNIDSLTLCDDAAGPEIGEWGEALVAQYLERQKQLGKILDYFWKNSEEETGCPFDFEIQLSGNSGILSNYIEVKSTVSEDKEVFEISMQQIQFAEHEKEKFHIYRVFNAGNPERVKLIRITNLDMRLAKKQVKLCMLI